MKILVTGGAGYIGSHTCVELLLEGYDVVVVDNLSNSSGESLNRVKKITGKQLDFFKLDLRNRDELKQVFSLHIFDAVIHFAGLKVISESVHYPLRYFQNNIEGTLALLDVMGEFKVHTMVFSSSAAVYGKPQTLPIKEDFPLSATSPYGRTKLIIEGILQDLFKADNSWNFALLRYFNPIGAHESGDLGDDPIGRPSNLLYHISQVALGKMSHLDIYGNDYDTHDGTGIRDYVHVVDLARGHIKTLARLFDKKGVLVYNFGTGNAYSVLDIVREFEKASKKKISYRFSGPRPGDVGACYTDPSKAKEELGWETVKKLEEMCSDTWKWLLKNPDGYPTQNR